MIEFNAYVRNPPAPRILVNNIGGVYRLDGGIIQVTFAWQFRDPQFQHGRAREPDLAESQLASTGTCCAGCRKKSPEETFCGASRSSGRTERAAPSLWWQRSVE